MLGQTAQASPKEITEKEKETNDNRVGSTKTMVTRNRCARRRISTTLLALWTAAYQATPSGRNATIPTLLPGLVLGFPPVHGGACGRGKPGALQEGSVAPAGVTASVPAKPTGISPVRHTSTSPAAPSHSTNLAAHQHAPPRSLDHHRRLTMEREARPTDLRGDSREQGAAKISSHAGGDNLHRPWRSPAGRSNRSTPGTRPGQARKDS